ncbi:MAG: hypothetical protein GY936_16315 [Ignavibacteriae bacterium]|nr:hypothetical protein [Ignavibacteriota bacterium]
MSSNVEKSYLGSYTKSDLETISRLMILDDHTFCFTFMGGSLDLVAVGNWKLNANPKLGIQLKEIRLQTQVFPAYIEKIKADDNKVKFIFDGYSMSNAEQPVFAMSSSDKVPSSFKPLFESGNSHWRDEYELPPVDANEVKYFYLGYTEVDKYDQPVKLKVFQYKLENGQQIKVGFNSIAVSPLISMTALIESNALKVDGKLFGTKDELPPHVTKEIRQNYIDPILKPKKHKSTQEEKLNQISPINEVTLDVKSISNQSFKFITPDPLAFMYKDWSYLTSKFSHALEDSSKVPNFLKVSIGLVQHQTPQKKNADSLIAHFINLLNNNDNTQTQFKLIDTFIDKIEPAIKSFREDEAFNKNFEIFVSNSLGLVVHHDNEALKLKIYKMLGDSFDIKKIKHGTLLYNLACDYSRKKDKPKMLEAIELAIKKGKKPENFAKDTDFKFYYSDPDFIKVITDY